MDKIKTVSHAVSKSLVFALAFLLLASFVQATAVINIYLDDYPAQATYTVKGDAFGNYWAVRYDGYKAIESTNPSTVINTVTSTYLPNGGLIHLGLGTFSLGNVAITFDDGDYGTKSWILEGEGIGTVISQSNAGISAIEISGATNVILRNFKVSCGVNAAHGIYLHGVNENLTSLRRGRISNVAVTVANVNSHALYAINIMDDMFDHLRLEHVGTGGSGVPLRVETASKTQHLGNSEFQAITAYTSQINAVELNGSATKNLNLCHFTQLQTARTGAVGTSVALKLFDNVNYNKFSFLDLESFYDGIYIMPSAIGKPSVGNTFLGGYIHGTTNCLRLGQWTDKNHFKDLTLTVDGGLDLIDDSGYTNLYEDLDGSAGTITLSGSDPSFKGTAPNGKYFENAGYQASCVNGTAITHGLAGTPTSVVLTMYGQNYINSTCWYLPPTLLSMNSTTFTVCFTIFNAGTIRAVAAPNSRTIYWESSYN